MRCPKCSCEMTLDLSGAWAKAYKCPLCGFIRVLEVRG